MENERSSNAIQYFLRGIFSPIVSCSNLTAPSYKTGKGYSGLRQRGEQNWMYYLCTGTLRACAANVLGNERIVALLGPDSIAGLDYLTFRC